MVKEKRVLIPLSLLDRMIGLLEADIGKPIGNACIFKGFMV